MTPGSPFTIRVGAAVQAQPPAPLQPFNLFATRIWQTRFGCPSAQLAQWLDFVLALRAQSPVAAGRSNRRGWNSQDLAILDREIFAALNQAIRAHCLQTFQEMGLAEPEFALQSWVNVHDRGGYNLQHMHEGALLSGCVYLAVPPGSGNLVFRDPRPGVLNSALRGSGANAFKDVQLRPEAGLIVLFPNWLEHYVEPHEGDSPRICIAFNALAKHP
jgi:uncharacterized protein (TIGR02466 family)